MKKTWVGAGLIVAALLTIGPDVDACGDKSLSAGGIRWQRALAARYPASVLAYVPATSRLSDAKRELKLEEALTRVGHTYVEVSDLTTLRDSVATGQFNIVLADLADIGAVQRNLDASPGRVVLVPVAYRGSRPGHDRISITFSRARRAMAASVGRRAREDHGPCPFGRQFVQKGAAVARQLGTILV